MTKITTDHACSSGATLHELSWGELLDCIEGPVGGEGPTTTPPQVDAEISRRFRLGLTPGHSIAPELSGSRRR